MEKIGSGLRKQIVLVFEVPDKSTESEYVLYVKGDGALAKKKKIVLKNK